MEVQLQGGFPRYSLRQQLIKRIYQLNTIGEYLNWLYSLCNKHSIKQTEYLVYLHLLFKEISYS